MGIFGETKTERRKKQKEKKKKKRKKMNDRKEKERKRKKKEGLSRLVWPEFRVQSSEFRVQSSEFRVPSAVQLSLACILHHQLALTLPSFVDVVYKYNIQKN